MAVYFGYLDDPRQSVHHNRNLHQFTIPEWRRGRIMTWTLPIVVLGMYALGALVGCFIHYFAWEFEFKGSIDDNGTYFLSYDKRRWWFNFNNRPGSLHLSDFNPWSAPRGRDSFWTQFGKWFTGQTQRGYEPIDQPLNDRKKRWKKNGEKDSAYLLRIAFSGRAEAQQRETITRERPELTAEFERLLRRRRWVAVQPDGQPVPNGRLANVPAAHTTGANVPVVHGPVANERV
jgi:hypothetical protein